MRQKCPLLRDTFTVLRNVTYSRPQNTFYRHKISVINFKSIDLILALNFAGEHCKFNYLLSSIRTLKRTELYCIANVGK